MKKESIVILGGGPAGLTAALELLRSGWKNVTILELESQVGGLARTIVYKGNRMDIGGHRFFSKSNMIMKWWLNVLPLQGKNTLKDIEVPMVSFSEKMNLSESGPDPKKEDNVMLLRRRLSRIFYIRKFFDYPVSLKWSTIKNLGLLRVITMGFGYIQSCLFPIKPEKTLEDFIINRFGRGLYNTFFRDYTEKVWGVPCRDISAEWGAQRIKGLSIARVLRHALLKICCKDTTIGQKNTDTSLIEQFLYPKFGPGHLWERVSEEIESLGGKILLGHKVVGLVMEENLVSNVTTLHCTTGEIYDIPCSAIISSIPMKDLIPMFKNVPPTVRDISDGLIYRDFITVGLLVKKLRLDNSVRNNSSSKTIRDNWIYIQEPDVHLGRIQIFNNWSPYLVADPNTVWLGLEYFVTEGDALWNMDDEAFKQMAIEELIFLSFITIDDVEDATILRVPKAYPAYFGRYSQIAEVQKFLNSIPNVYPIGRSGMHRYNNMDHSMLSAMQAVACLNDPTIDKTDIWRVNTEKVYHESS